MKSATGWSAQEFVCLCIFLCATFCAQTDSSAVKLQSDNMDQILKTNELVFVNFYADWCRFSQMLAPIFDQAAEKVKNEFPEQGKVVLGKVDCDKEGGIAAQYHVSKYPTLKVFRYGTLIKREYRGQRSAEALATYVKDAIKDPIKRITTMEELENLDGPVEEPSVFEDYSRNMRYIIGYFDSETSEDFVTFRKLASMLRDDCQFLAAIGTVSEAHRTTGNRVVFRPADSDTSDIPYPGDLTAFDLLHLWAVDKCVPLVREITFENAEELTEEGLPFLILFHNLDDTETPSKFRNVVAKELLEEKNGVNFLTADGNKFSHPLYHLGKSTSDLPVLAIDSFRHMYVWKKDPRENLENGAALKEFIADLHSGKLHREFHHGPDKPTEMPALGADGDKHAVATEADAAHNNAHVQQLLIKSPNGMTVQIVRIVEIGNPRELNLQEGLKMAEKVQAQSGETASQKRWDEEVGNVLKASTTLAPGQKTSDTAEVASEKDVDLAEGEQKIIHTKVIPISLSPHVKAFEQQDEPLVRHPMNENLPPQHDGQPLDPEGRPANPQGQPMHPRSQPVHFDPHDQLMDFRGQRLNARDHEARLRMREMQQRGRAPNRQRAPPESIFRHLGPSKSKYTILRDEF